MQIDEKFTEKFEPLIADELSTLKIGGLAVAIVHEKGIVYSQGFGARDLEKSLPADPDTIFAIGSVTKSFVCVAIQQLAEQRKLDIDDSVSKYLPLKLDYENRPVTLRHLMSHTSGIPDLSGNTSTYLADSLDIPTPPDAQLIPFASDNDVYRHINGAKEFVVRPGERFHYNNLGYALLSFIIEEVSGEDFSSYVKKHVLDPLDMKRSTFLVKDLETDENVAQGYMNKRKGKDRGSVITAVPYFEKRTYSGAGGLLSSVRELANYMIMHMHEGSFGRDQILTRDSVQDMQISQLNEESLADQYLSALAMSGKGGYGLGLFVNEDFFGHRLIHHGGSTIGGSADFLFLPDLKLGIVALGNNAIGPHLIIYTGLAMLLGRDLETEIPFYAVRKHLESLTGEYETYKGGYKLKVTRQGALLQLEAAFVSDWTGPPTPILPVNTKDHTNMTFYIPTLSGARMLIFFEKDDKGDVWLSVERQRYKRAKDL